MKATWEDNVLRNFNIASFNYNNEAMLQKDIAKQLAQECSKQNISSGLWMDLGTGTGLLANAIEELSPNQSVLRVDGSIKMLKQHAPNKLTKLFH